MIVFRTPKGWTCPKQIDGKKTEGSWRAHQVPLASAKDTHEHFRVLRGWLKSYKPEELFKAAGPPVAPVAAFPPAGTRRLGADPPTDGGLLLRDLRTPDFRDYAVEVKAPGAVEAQDMYVLGTYVRDVMKLNMDARNFRIFAPDETASNRLQAVFEVTGRRFLDELKQLLQAQGIPYDQYSKMTGMDEAKFMEDGREPAVRQVKMDLAIAAIIKAENLDVTDEEIEEKYKSMAEQYGMELDMLKKYLDAPTVRNQLLNEKAIAVVVDSAKAEKPAKAEKTEGEEEKKPAKKAAAKKTTKKAAKKADEAAAAHTEAAAE